MAPDVRRRRGHWERAPRSFEGEVQKVRTVRRHRHTLHHNVPLSSRKQNRGPVGAASSAASRCTSTATSGKSVAWWLSRPCLDVSWKLLVGPVRDPCLLSRQEPSEGGRAPLPEQPARRRTRSLYSRRRRSGPTPTSSGEPVPAKGSAECGLSAKSSWTWFASISYHRNLPTGIARIPFSEHRVISTGHTQFLWHGGLLRAATWMNCQFAALLARRKPTDTQMMVLLQCFTMGCKNMIGGLRCGACNLVVLFRNLLPGHGDWVLVRRGKWNLNVWNWWSLALHVGWKIESNRRIPLCATFRNRSSVWSWQKVDQVYINSQNLEPRRAWQSTVPFFSSKCNAYFFASEKPGVWIMGARCLAFRPKKGWTAKTCGRTSFGSNERGLAAQSG